MGILGEEENVHEDSALPLGSAVPFRNPTKLNRHIESTNKKEKHSTKKVMHTLLSPLTATNKREQKFKKNLEGTYGKNYDK